jgi:superoxide dismutase, Cu-Zn family
MACLSQRYRVLTLATLTVAISPMAVSAAGTGEAELKLKDGSSAGRIEIISAPSGAFIRIKVTGLTPGGHAVKIHETGKCEGDFSGAGAILNPLGAGQGLLNDEGPAAGDLPNLFVSATGDGQAEFVTPLLQPGADEGDALFDEDGAAVVIYDKEDDHLGLSEGVVGERIACGIISKKS